MQYGLCLVEGRVMSAVWSALCEVCSMEYPIRSMEWLLCLDHALEFE